ncbi:MAG TPA: hypothetical protein VIG67_02880, partial [Yaniella sp.]
LEQTAGRIADPELRPTLGAAEAAVATLEQRFAQDPFTAPTATELDELHQITCRRNRQNADCPEPGCSSRA